MSSAAKVVTVLIVEAGLRGVSGLWLITTRPVSASRMTKLEALDGRRCAAINCVMLVGTTPLVPAAIAPPHSTAQPQARARRLSTRMIGFIN